MLHRISCFPIYFPCIQKYCPQNLIEFCSIHKAYIPLCKAHLYYLNCCKRYIKMIYCYRIFTVDLNYLVITNIFLDVGIKFVVNLI